MEKPHLGISFEEPISSSVFEEFENAVYSEALRLRIEGREKSGPFAGLEWLMPTVVILFIGRSYFDAFLKEMGKDHYNLLKKGISLLYERLIGKHAPRITLFSTQGKVKKNQIYSFAFSIVAEAKDGKRFKLLIQDGATEAEYNQITEAFLLFLGNYHTGLLSAKMVEAISNAPIASKTILLALNYDTKELEIIDPTPQAQLH